METVLHVGLSNAVMAGLLALLAAVVGRLVRNPALTHSLWLLVLLKLVTPPMIAVSVPQFPSSPTASTEQKMASAGGDPARLELEESRLLSMLEARLSAEELGRLHADRHEPTAGIAAAPETFEMSSLPWEQTVLLAWLGGSVLWWSVAGRRLFRFGRVLSYSRPAGAEIQEQAERLAALLNRKLCPRICFVDAPISPLLWAICCQPRLVIPQALWNVLNGQQREALLVHELAHWRRRDHWVRILELAVFGLYWWHPAVWWARRELREAEEQCCDAWVVWALPAASAAYATALVETAAFLSQTRPALPLAASGMGHVRLMRRRLTMILRGPAPRALSGAAFLVVLALGAGLLPLLPTLAQSAPDETDPQEPAVAVPATPATTAQQGRTATRTRLGIVSQEQVEDARDAVELLEAQYQVKAAQLRAALLDIQYAEKRLARLTELHRTGALSIEELDNARRELDTTRSQQQVKQAEAQEPAIKLQQARRRLERLQALAGQAASVRAVMSEGTTTARTGTASDEHEREIAALRKRLEAVVRENEKIRQDQNDKGKLAEKMLLEMALKQVTRQDTESLQGKPANKPDGTGAVGRWTRASSPKPGAENPPAKVNQAFEATSSVFRENPASTVGDDTARLERLEKRLDLLLRELEALRAELKPKTETRSK